MTLLPVIARELRAQSRQPFTYWVRVLGAGALLVTVFIFFPDIEFGKQLGQRYFAILHRVLFFAIWILVPMMTADCISRERRENTLGLLFLTLLKPKDIVLAKSFAHGLRAATLCIAVLPVFMICFLMGGVSWKEVFMSGMMNFCSLCWALAAGILASSSTKIWARALVGAESFAVVFGMVFGLLNYLIACALIIPRIPSARWDVTFEQFTEGALMVATNFGGAYRGILSSPKTAQVAWLVSAGVMSLVSLAALWVIVLIAARNVRRNWQEKPRSAFQIWWEKYLCTPVVMLSLFKRWMKFKLERNPIGWLEVRTWSGRLVIWGWFAVMVSVMTIALWDGNLYQIRFHEIHSFMAWLLVLSIASSAAGSFQRERETGVLELLLVAPLKVKDIINGRLRGLWGQFLPAILLLLGVWIYWTNTFEKMDENRHILFFATTFTTLPVIGLYCSLSSRNFIISLLRTILWSVALPMVIVPLSFWFLTPPKYGFGGYSYTSVSTLAVVQLLFALLFWLRLFRNLNERKFSFYRAIN